MLLAFGFSGWENWLISIAIAAGFVGLAYLSRLVIKRCFGSLTRITKTSLDDLIIKGMISPIFVGLIVAGIWIALRNINELADYLSTINKIFISIFTIIVAFTITRVINAFLTSYGNEIAVRTETEIDDKLIPLLRRVVTVVVFILAALFIVQQYTQIAPLLAGLGIGGVAVALALQPTLTNFLAGTYVMSDAVIHKGDYVMLESGQEGFIEDIGWRITKIRHWQGNLIIMPNSKLSDSVVFNFDKPDKSMTFSIDCGVSYDSDLEKVERVTMEVAKEILTVYLKDDKNFQPVIRFKEFGDSNIIFAIVLKSDDRAGQFVVKHEFIKALHQRYMKEGINIEYPVRRIYFNNPEKALKIN
jgi:small-conductance mechanosensitive channel